MFQPPFGAEIGSILLYGIMIIAVLVLGILAQAAIMMPIVGLIILIFHPKTSWQRIKDFWHYTILRQPYDLIERNSSDVDRS